MAGHGLTREALTLELEGGVERVEEALDRLTQAQARPEVGCHAVHSYRALTRGGTVPRDLPRQSRQLPNLGQLRMGCRIRLGQAGLGDLQG